MSTPRWVLHLPTTLTSFEAAVDLVDHLRELLAHVPVLDFHGATLTEKDRVMVRHPVYCAGPLPERRSCGLRFEHAGPCLGTPELHPAYR
ncbi:hypothetical protein [Micromonospora zhanjiangensis]|uniref:Uncharacterized protein n=1 Tax=Micromonospora zhanjiangensis TaxID=1522057 RepID=A0ABV8KNN6_9ACTN